MVLIAPVSMVEKLTLSPACTSSSDRPPCTLNCSAAPAAFAPTVPFCVCRRRAPPGGSTGRATPSAPLRQPPHPATRSYPPAEARGVRGSTAARANAVRTRARSPASRRPPSSDPGAPRAPRARSRRAPSPSSPSASSHLARLKRTAAVSFTAATRLNFSRPSAKRPASASAAPCRKSSLAATISGGLVRQRHPDRRGLGSHIGAAASAASPRTTAPARLWTARRKSSTIDYDSRMAHQRLPEGLFAGG